MTKCLVSWSSGKDSAWMVHTLRQRGDIEIGALLTTINEPAQRVAMHAVRVEVLQDQAAALGLPLWMVPIPSPCPNEVYEERMREVVARAVAAGFTHAAFGDLFLEDIRRYREEKLAGSGLEPLFPVWGIPTGELAEQMIDGGLCARLACVDTRHLDESFVGREFDRSLLRDLPVGIDPCGERGEFHSCVYAGPMFREPIALRAGDTHAVSPFVWRDLTVAADPLNGVGSHFQVTSVPEK